MTGKLTPLNINLLTGLLQNKGLKINSEMTNYVGTSQAVGSYTKGSVITSTVLNNITDSFGLAYPLIDNGITEQDYINLLSIGANSIPALGNGKPSTYTEPFTGEKAKFGFLRLLALQAHQELNYGTGYAGFLESFSQAHTYMVSQNKIVNSLSNGKTFGQGTFSNTNDLVTAEISGVNLSLFYWGRDLITLGRALDLTRIERFGTPSELLYIIQNNNGFNKTLSLALLTTGLTSNTILNILSKSITPTNEQEKKIYSAFKLIIGADLAEILIPMNCRTNGLNSLADLLDPKKIFPNSYNSLTTPVYNTTQSPTNSKTYYLIYSGNSVNNQLGTYGSDLRSIIPNDVAIAADAFRIAMLQIKNITRMDIEKFSQVVSVLETARDLSLGTTDIPVNTAQVNQVFQNIAKGSDINGSYNMYDFFGSMAAVGYKIPKLQELILKLQSTNLATIYSTIKSLLQGAGPYTSLSTYITQANTEIVNIQNNFPSLATEINALYSSIGTMLNNEIANRTAALIESTSDISSIYSFVDSINTYALETDPKYSADLLEKISDTTEIAGSSLIGSMREIRNMRRLSLLGSNPDNLVDSKAERTYVNTTGVNKITGNAIPGSLAGSRQTNLIPPNLDVYNYSTLKPSTYNPTEAVEEVTLCNCDCWDNLGNP